MVSGDKYELSRWAGPQAVVANGGRQAGDQRGKAGGGAVLGVASGDWSRAGGNR